MDMMHGQPCTGERNLLNMDLFQYYFRAAIEWLQWTTWGDPGP